MDDLNEQLREWQNELPQHLDENIRMFRDKVKWFGSFNVIANLFARNSITTPQTHEKRKIKMSPVSAEYAALICIKSDYSVGLGEFTDARNVAKNLAELNELARTITSQAQYLLTEKFTDSDLDNVARAMLSDEFNIRNRAFECHHWEVCEELFAPFNKEISSVYGFTIESAIDICTALHEFVAKQFTDGMVDLRKTVEDQYYEVLRYLDYGIIKHEFLREYYESYRHWNRKLIKLDLVGSSHTYFEVTLGDRLSFTPELLSNQYGLNINEVRSFLNLFSIGFLEDSNIKERPEVFHVLKRTPIIVHNDNYICSSFGLLDFAIDDVLDEFLIANSNKKLSQRYSNWKHDFYLNKTLTLLKGLLPKSEVHQNLDFNNDGIAGEADGIVLYANTAFFIEVKTNRLTQSSRRGGIERVKTHLDAIVKKSYDQAKSAMMFLKGNDQAAFIRRKDQKRVIIDGSKIDKAFIICISPENVNPIVTSLKMENSLSLFEEEYFPFIINLYDLMIIADHIESPSFFYHYIERRKSFFEKGHFFITDEIDIFGYFLFNSLYFGEDAEKCDWVSLAPISDEFDAYYLNMKINGQIAKKSHCTPFHIKNFIFSIEKSNLPGFLNITLPLLNLNTRSQNEFFSKVKLSKQRFKKDRDIHDCSIGMEYGKLIGLTYMIGINSEASHRKLKKFCEHKLKSTDRDCWFGILDTAHSSYSFVDIQIMYKTGHEV